MIADPDGVSRRIGQSALGKAGFSVEAVGNGQAALEVLSGELFDLLVCEIELGDMTGWQLQRRLKARRSSPGFVFWSSDGRVERRSEAYRAGAEYLTKPVEHHELVARVESLVAARRSMLAKAGRRYLLAGYFEAIGLAELVAMFDLARRSGVLSFVSRAPGAFHFRDGLIVRAEYGNLCGVAAFVRAIQETTGHFEMEPVDRGVEPDPTMTSISPTHLLIEAARVQDTASHASCASPLSDDLLAKVSESDDLEIVGEGSGHASPPRESSSPSAQPRRRRRAAPSLSSADSLDLLPACPPNPVFGRVSAGTMEDEYSLGELELLTRTALCAWDVKERPRERALVVLVGDVQLIVPGLLAMASPASEAVVLTAMSSEEKTPVLAFHLRNDRMINVVVSEVGSLAQLLKGIGRHPSIILIVPEDGDILGLGAHGRVVLERVLVRLPSTLIVGVGDQSVAEFLAKLRSSGPRPLGTSFVSGVLGRQRLTLRKVLSESFMIWGELGRGLPPWT